LVQFLFDARRLCGQLRSVEKDPSLLDSGEDGDEGLLERLVDLEQQLPFEELPENGRELTCEVGALAGILDRGFNRHVDERHRLDARPQTSSSLSAL
jgi:hypothetical protein